MAYSGLKNVNVKLEDHMDNNKRVLSKNIIYHFNSFIFFGGFFVARFSLWEPSMTKRRVQTNTGMCYCKVICFKPHLDS